jgi:hypothetical protein
VDSQTRSAHQVPFRLFLEFIVIMAGVLAALAADEWRQSVSERALAGEYLARLKLDLETDTATWRSIRSSVTDKIRGLDGAMSWIREPDYAPGAVSNFLSDLTDGTRMAYGAQTTVAQTTFDELLSSGRMELVRVIPLRRALMGYYYRVDLQRTRVLARETRYAPIIYELVPRDPEFVVSPSLDDSEKERIARRGERLDLEPLITAERNRGRLRLEVADEMLERATTLLAMVEDAAGAS